MDEQSMFPASMMVRIDGAKIRAIREAKGLTQLYVATAVAVTTDTVSRWENRKYPSIKKENAVKLAEALEVDLEKILETAEEPGGEAAAGVEPADPDPEPRTPAPPVAPRAGPARRLAVPPFPLLVVALAAAAALAGTGYLIYTAMMPEPVPAPTATRIVAPHFIPGQPLPVVIRVDQAGPEPAALIVTEHLPPGSGLVAASPPLSSGDSGDQTIKWLARVEGTQRFSYTVVTGADFQGSLHFSGAAVVAANDRETPIEGDSRSAAGLHHWADTDRDNRIGDSEILTVYDRFSGLETDIVDIDFLEEMWLGDGYVWLPESRHLSIVE